MKIEHLGLSQINGSLVVLENVINPKFDEMVEFSLADGTKRTGRIVTVEGDKVAVQVFEGTGGISMTNVKTTLTGKPIEIKLSPASFGRGAAGAAKQSLRNDIRDYENAQLVEQFKDKVGECITAKVVRIDAVSGIATLQVEKNEILLFKSEQIPGEIIREGQFVKVYVMEIKNSDKKPAVKVSRKHHGLVKRLFELEVPEIHDGTVEIKSISREAGVRTKIAVMSNDENVDAKGACIGPRRSRITKIIEELEGEKIDIIQYSENDEEFIAAALSPAQVISVTINDPEPDEKTGEIIVAEGNRIDAAAAQLIEDKGINRVFVAVEDRKVVVFSNNMVDPEKYAGISLYDLTHEKVRKSVLDEILEAAAGDMEEIKNAILKIKGVKGVHHIHVWSMDGINNYATMHVVTDTEKS